MTTPAIWDGRHMTSVEKHGPVGPVMALVELVRAMARANAIRDIATARAKPAPALDTKSGSDEPGTK